MSEVRKTLEEIAERNGGLITPANVVEEAAAPDNPLHEYFTWDNNEAAHKQRLHEARQLIRSVKVVVTTTQLSAPCPQWVRDPVLRGPEQGYRSIAALRTDDDAARDVLVNEFARAAAALGRAKAVAAALGLSDEVADVLRNVQILARSLRDGDGMAGSA